MLTYPAATQQHQVVTDYPGMLPLLLAAFFKLSMTEGLMLSNMNRPSSPGYRHLQEKQRKISFYKIQIYFFNM